MVVLVQAESFLKTVNRKLRKKNPEVKFMTFFKKIPTLHHAIKYVEEFVLFLEDTPWNRRGSRNK